MGTPKWTVAAWTGKQGISQAAVAEAASSGYKSGIKSCQCLYTRKIGGLDAETV